MDTSIHHYCNFGWKGCHTIEQAVLTVQLLNLTHTLMQTSQGMNMLKDDNVKNAETAL